MTITVAPASPSFQDWSGLLALLRDSFAFMEGRIDPPSSLEGMTTADLQAKARKEHLLVVLQDDKLIGCAFVHVREACVYVGKVAVAHTARGQGICRRLMAEADAIARAAGRPVLELQTRIELTENHRTFAALGFQKTAETAHPGYTRTTSITMQRAVAALEDDTP
jgi:predicted GNAT family N-acyltransferase